MDSTRAHADTVRSSLSLTMLVLTLAMPPLALAQRAPADNGMYCTSTAQTIERSCRFEATDDYYKAQSICINLSEAEERTECYELATTERSDNLESCTAQLAARRAVCAAVGERRYDPEFDEIDHETNFNSPAFSNPYFPLKVGNKAELHGGGEVVSIEVLDATKLIDEVRCIVVRDIVTVDGQLREATDDWFAVARDGTVWYCGEEVKDYEFTEGDEPPAPQLVSRDGTFKAGISGDKPGILFLGTPRVGRVYREEFSVGNAEDVSRVLSTNYGYGDVPALDRFVPRDLALLMCTRDCVVTEAFTAMDPGVVEYKYYARGIGQFLNVKRATGETVQLASCNFDPRCRSLPQP